MILWGSMKDRTVEMTPGEFGLLMNGHKNEDDKDYKVMYKTDDDGNITKVNLFPVGEIKDGQEFTIVVKIVEKGK